MKTVPASLRTLLGRLDIDEYDVPGGSARVRLAVSGRGAWDLEIRGGRQRVRHASGGAEPDAELTADAQTWQAIADDVANGMAAFHVGKLQIRRNLHLGVGFLAATSGDRDPGRLRLGSLETRFGRVSTVQAGTGTPLVMLHGLGGSKKDFLPTIATLGRRGYRAIAIDLPGFGDSDKPFPAPYDAPFFARWVLAALDALELDRVHLLGHSMGGRVALEVGFESPERVSSLVLMTPSMAWLADRPWARWLRLVRPELGLLQPSPRPIVEGIVKRVVPGADSAGVAPVIDEFLRAYLDPRGRVAFYAAARQIYLEDPSRFWSSLQSLSPRALFIWGKRDTLVPIGFQRHVRDSLPAARHIVLACGHAPQLERPKELHHAIESFLARGPAGVPASRGRLRVAGGGRRRAAS
jgi:pimeloyl-ACP methyl ester carboxylesterase